MVGADPGLTVPLGLFGGYAVIFELHTDRPTPSPIASAAGAVVRSLPERL